MISLVFIPGHGGHKISVVASLKLELCHESGPSNQMDDTLLHRAVKREGVVKRDWQAVEQ